MLYGVLPVVKMDDGKELHGVKVAVVNPPKTAVLGLPTNAQMVERLSKQRSIRRSLGRRVSQTESVPNPAADLALFNDCRQDKGGAEFDEYEAANAMSKLTYCEVIDCQRAGEEYLIQLKTAFGVTVHTVKIPMQREITAYRRSVVSSRDLPHGQEELRFRIEPAVALYDQVSVKTEGYAPEWKLADVPPHHKSAVVSELVQAIDDLDPEIDPNS